MHPSTGRIVRQGSGSPARGGRHGSARGSRHARWRPSASPPKSHSTKRRSPAAASARWQSSEAQPAVGAASLGVKGERRAATASVSARGSPKRSWVSGNGAASTSKSASPSLRTAPGSARRSGHSRGLSSSASPPPPRRDDQIYSFAVFGGNNPTVLRKTLEARRWWYIHEVRVPSSVEHVIRHVLPAADFVWKPTLFVRRPVPTKPVCTLHTVAPEWPGPLQLVNHFPEVKCLTSKTGLLRSMRKFYTAASRDVFHNLPSSYIVGSKEGKVLASAEWKRFLRHFKALERGDYVGSGERLPQKHCVENLWLLKPSFLNQVRTHAALQAAPHCPLALTFALKTLPQGRGIEVFSDLGRLKRHIAQSATGKHEWVLQKYLERPLLLWKRKFDIRIWALVDDDFNIWMCVVLLPCTVTACMVTACCEWWWPAATRTVT